MVPLEIASVLGMFVYLTAELSLSTEQVRWPGIEILPGCAGHTSRQIPGVPVSGLQMAYHQN